ncbi:hypothetical protein [Psychromonas hadalis]|uniref:hypothetical protein n=1 Tax=Psychromonas hadalis TaxID=211669 RepID=UPI0003B585BA|nr:hypothetical protein [Psychromonas hadalis]
MISIKRPLAAIIFSLCASTAIAGTAGLTGKYVGDYQMTVRTTTNQTMAKTVQNYRWVWDFDAKTATINPGFIRSHMALIPIAYAAHQPTTIDDNGDGTYTVHYIFQAYNPLFGFPSSQTSTTFEITDTGFGLDIKTLDTDSNGVPGSAIYGIFPFDIELDWQGSAN